MNPQITHDGPKVRRYMGCGAWIGFILGIVLGSLIVVAAGVPDLTSLPQLLGWLVGLIPAIFGFALVPTMVGGLGGLLVGVVLSLIKPHPRINR
jgi:hypothetical protein